jgi:CHAT domain-containing protein
LQGQSLQPGELLLDLYAGPEQSLLFAVTRHAIQVVRLPDEKKLSQQLELLQGLLTSSTAQAQVVEEVLDNVGRQFLAPVRAQLALASRVLYSPDGAMHLLPLGALRLDGKALIATKEVLRLPSAAVLYELRARAVERDADGGRAAADAPRRWLALAGGSQDASDLRAAQTEVMRLHRRFADVELRLPRADQGPELELAELADYRLIHFAAHALVSDRQPWRSSLVLSGLGAGELRAASRVQVEDLGRLLRADQIAELKLRAELVVLAACESAGGPVLSGEGVLGLTTAFLSAGVPVVVAALWPVDDAATAELMRHFYDRLAAGDNVGAALRTAQLALAQAPATAHPFYWAGFVAVGDASRSVELRAATNLWRIGLPVLAIGLIAAFSFLWRPKRRR